MLWNGEPNAGFTTGEPWLPLSPDWRGLTLEAQAADPDSMLKLYRRLLALRRAEPALHSGVWVPLGVQGEVLLYARAAEDGARFVVAVNFGEAATVELGARGQVVVHTDRAREGEAVDGELALGPHAAAAVRCR
jgi:alpha-glucosidase